MQPIFHAVINRNWAQPRRIASPQDADCLCDGLAEMPAFTVAVTSEAGQNGATLDVFVESGRALVGFTDIGRSIKLVSRDEACTERGIVCLRNDAHPDLQLDQIEVHRRDLIAPAQAISILRHYLHTSEPTGLVPWPPDDWDQWGDSEFAPSPPQEDNPF